MMRSSLNGVYQDGSRQVLWEDGERVFCRGWRQGDDGNPSAVLVVLPAAERPSPSSLDNGLKDELDGAWSEPTVAFEAYRLPRSPSGRRGRLDRL